MHDIYFKLGQTDSRIRDIHRKLASIKDQLPDACQGFLNGRCVAEFNEDMEVAINAFKKKHHLPEDGICDGPTWHMLDKEAGTLFTEAWQYELDALRTRREPAGVRPADEREVIHAAHDANLAGLAFSGGGVRSATFNLGLLQALAEKKMLRDFDYLSTVSGGGYIGAWFSKWLNREHGDIDQMEKNLTPGTREAPLRHEPDEIRFLRQYSNYLTPKTGLFSADTWSLFATYFRNTVLNLSILAALLAALLIVPRLLGFFVGSYGQTHAELFAWLGAGSALWAVFFIALSVSSVPDPRAKQWIRGQTQASILALVVLPLMISAFSASIAVWNFREQFGAIWDAIPPAQAHPVLTWVVLPGLFYCAAWLLGWLAAQLFNRGTSQASVKWRDAIREGAGHLLCAVVALAVGVLLLTGSVSALARAQPEWASAAGPALGIHLISFGMPFMLSIFGIAMILTIGLVGRMYNDKSREWWSRQGGWTAICTLAWFGLSAISLYGPAFISYLGANLGGWTQALLASAWFGTTLVGLALGRSDATGKKNSRPYLEWLAALAPLVFSVGALLLLSTLAYFMILPGAVPGATWAAGQEWNAGLAGYYADAGSITPRRALLVMLLLLAAGSVLAWRVDINKFSLYMMYRNRLVRTYLGASNLHRKAHPFTGFDEKDDIHLDGLLQTGGVLQRPFHIMNATLNLANGKELAWQTRKAAGFSFTPAFCGFELPSMASGGQMRVAQEAARGCYRRTKRYRRAVGVRGDEEVGIKLGMATAVCGAAVSPNMGYHSSPALAFLMTLFNVRLGRWFANPRRRHWARPAPILGLRYLLAELFGMSDSDSGYVHLSDGGHFENLAIYELVRRRCKLIVVVDASADGDLNFEDLGNAIRKCATDLHVDIDIDVGQIDRLRPSEFSKAYCVAGEILYERTDKDAANGTLLYIKPALMGNECADVLNYRKANKDFPHQSTADQWFDETQFESYRSLGYRIGQIVFDQSAAASTVTGKPGHSIPALAQAIRKAWGKQGAPTPLVVTPVPAQPVPAASEPAPQQDGSEVDAAIGKIDEKV